jgi:hypothetical protein
VRQDGPFEDQSIFVIGDKWNNEKRRLFCVISNANMAAVRTCELEATLAPLNAERYAYTFNCCIFKKLK